MPEAVLEVKGLRVDLPTPDGYVTVVDGVDYRVDRKAVFGIAGESGSGKTMSVFAILGLLPPGSRTWGEVWFGGRDLMRLSSAERRLVAGRHIAMVFQDPMTSLHPMLTIGRQMTEHVRYHLELSKTESKTRAIDLLRQVRIPDPSGALNRYPHQFSGGMRQRIAIAIALACDPSVLIADEPTTALDVTIQAGVLALMDRLRHEVDLSVVLITHDLGVMSSIADYLSIFYAGRVVEAGSRADVLRKPRHPYTSGLLEALPHPDRMHDEALVAIPGSPPNPASRPFGCAFHPRCRYSNATCEVAVPPLLSVSGGTRSLACPVDPHR